MSIPADLEKVITASGLSEGEFWRVVSEAHYAELVAQNRDHLLVFVDGQIDFSELVAACAAYRAYAGERGQEETHTVKQLCRAVVAKAVKGWSYRTAEEEIRSNELVRWFVGYDLHEPTPDHMTLWRFESWVKAHQPRLFFDGVLRAIDEAFPEEAQQAQIGDTFAMASRAREQSRTELMRMAAAKVLHHLEVATPAAYAQLLGQVDGVGLFGTEEEKPERFLEKAERDALELRTGRAVHGLLCAVAPLLAALPTNRDIALAGLRQWYDVLHKALEDEFIVTTNTDGQLLTLAHPTERRKGRYRRGSAVDLDATFRIHGDFSTFGYNINVAATPTFIREINAVTGATPDSSGVAPLIANQLEQLGLVPPKLIYDKAAGTPKIFAQVATASDHQTQLVARLVDYTKSRDHFGPLDFTLDDGLQLTCPAGQTTKERTYSGSAEGWNYRFRPAQCADCPLFRQCRGPKGKVGTRRQVFINDYRYTQLKALAYTKTAAFQLDMALRPNIERIIAGVTRYNDGRHARGYGLVNADYQVKMAAMAYNLKRWHKIVQEQKQAQRYKPPPSVAIDGD